MMSFLTKQVGELLEPVPRQSKIKRSEYQERGRIPIIDQSQAFIAGYTDDEETIYQGKLPVIVFGDHTRILKYVDFPFCIGADGTQLLRPIEGLDIRYFFYALRNIDLGSYGYERHFKYLKEKKVVLPPFSVQCRIAATLSAYDDLIENALRRVKILEEMVRASYREWFEEFRFPAHSTTRVESALGLVPHGWKVKKLNQVASVNLAQISPRTAPEVLHYIDISSVSPGRIDSITTYPFSEAPSRARRVVQHGDVIWSCVRPNRRSHALVMRPKPDTIASTGFAVLTAEEIPFPFLYLATTTDDFVAYLTNHATGAAYPAVSAKTFQDAALLVPPEPLLKKFGDATGPMFEEISLLQDQSRVLQRTRDLLLPKLLSPESTTE